MPNPNASEPGVNLKFAQVVSKVISDRGWSLRGAEQYTGVKHSTVQRMVKGFPVEAEAIIRFVGATAAPGSLASTLLHWLELADKKELAAVIRRALAEVGSVAAGDVNQLLSRVPVGLRHLPEYILKEAHERAEKTAQEEYTKTFRLVSELLVESATQNQVGPGVETEGPTLYFSPVQRASGRSLRSPTGSLDELLEDGAKKASAKQTEPENKENAA